MEQLLIPLLIETVKSIVKVAAAHITKHLLSRKKGRTTPVHRDGSDSK